MQTYLKTRPVGAQALIFFSLVAAAWLIFGNIGAAIAIKLTGLSLSEIQNIANWNAGDRRYLPFLRLMLVVNFVGLFVAPALVFAYLSDPKPMRYLGLQKAPLLFYIAGTLAMVTALPLVEYLGLLNHQVNFPDSVEGWMKTTEKQAQQQIRLLLHRESPFDLLLNLIMIAGFAGVGEELFFRGVLQRLAIWGFKNVWAGIIVTAFVFSALHLQFYGFFPRFMLGILLGLIYWYSGSLWPAILAHFFYDALLITLAYFNPSMLAEDQASLIPAQASAAMAAVSLVLTVALVLYMRRNSTATQHRTGEERDLKEPPSFTSS